MTLDQQLQFLQTEIEYLRQRTEPWAQKKIVCLCAVRETVRTARQEKAMTSETTGKRIQ
jgi:hypothetical protein